MKIITGYPWNEFVKTSNKMYDSYMNGDDPILGIPRNEIMVIDRDLVFYVPYIPLYLTPPIFSNK